MVSVRAVERRIRRVEGFRVAIRDRYGRDLRSDLQGLPGYPFHRAASNSMTVSQWKETRFQPAYSGYTCAVLDRQGNPVHGNTLLSTLRASYSP